MITEIALLTIDPDRAEAFEAAVAGAAHLFRRAPGCHSMALEREIEDPARYRLRVEWESVEAHMEGFRTSPDFQAWRAAAGPFFVSPPDMVHAEPATRFF